jgi:type I restriction enzyme R subunit
MADTAERQFQRDIIESLRADGWLVGDAAEYDRANALYPADLVSFVQEAQPERWQRFADNNRGRAEQALINAVVRELGKRDTLSVLRHGIKVVPVRQFDLCGFRPDHGMNPEALARYRANRLRVVPEVAYSPHARPGAYNPRLDLVLFVNGIPTATLELKSAFKQSVEHAKQQYKKDRPTSDPKTRKQAGAAADVQARGAGALRREPGRSGDDHVPGGR